MGTLSRGAVCVGVVISTCMSGLALVRRGFLLVSCKLSAMLYHLGRLAGKASDSRATDAGSNPALPHRDFFLVGSYQKLVNWFSGDYSAGRLVVQAQ